MDVPNTIVSCPALPDQKVQVSPRVLAAERAAILPGAPMTPPPGWAPLPRRRRLGTAVLGPGEWSAVGRVR